MNLARRPLFRRLSSSYPPTRMAQCHSQKMRVNTGPTLRLIWSLSPRVQNQRGATAKVLPLVRPRSDFHPPIPTATGGSPSFFFLIFVNLFMSLRRCYSNITCFKNSKFRPSKKKVFLSHAKVRSKSVIT